MSEKTVRGLMFLIAAFTPIIVYLGLGPDGFGVLPIEIKAYPTVFKNKELPDDNKARRTFELAKYSQWLSKQGHLILNKHY